MRRRTLAQLVVRAAAAIAVMLGTWDAAVRAQPPRPKDTVDPAKADLSETVGLLSGLHLYQTYLNIGMIADCKTEGVYPEKDARTLLASIMTPLEKIDKQLEKVLKRMTEKDDREALDTVRKLVSVLREEGKQLQLYWETGKAEHSTKYEAARKEAWAGISKLLGIEEP
jgi:hypothetical protein